jgi:hypothetical protein
MFWVSSELVKLSSDHVEEGPSNLKQLSVVRLALKGWKSFTSPAVLLFPLLGLSWKQLLTGQKTHY